MLALITQLFWLVCAVEQIGASKHINITIMVPGIEAFRILTEEASKFPELLNYEMKENDNHYHHDYLHGIETLDDISYEQLLPINATSQFNDFEYYEAVDTDDNIHLNLDRFLEEHHHTYSWSYVFIKSALDIALADIKKLKLLKGYQLNLCYYDSGNEIGRSSDRMAQISSVDSLINDHMIALVGPINSFAMSRVLTFTSHYGILHITPGAVAKSLRRLSVEENAQNTMVRTGPVAGIVGDCITSILNFYNWSIAAEVFEDDFDERYHYFIAEGVYDSVTRHNYNLELKQERLSEYLTEDLTTSYRMDDLMKNIADQGRMISAALPVIGDFLQEASYHHNNEYAYVIIDLENKLGTKPWLMFDAGKKHSVPINFKKVFESTLIVTLGHPNNTRFEEFVTALTNKISSFPDEKTKVSQLLAQALTKKEQSKYGISEPRDYFEKNLYPALFYDSIHMLAKLIDSSLNKYNVEHYTHEDEPYIDPWGTPLEENAIHNGKAMFENFITKTKYNGITGAMIFNEDGDRLLNFSVWSFNPNKDEFYRVAYYDPAKNVYEETSKIFWPNNAPPLDTPKCGFDGGKCSLSGLSVTNVTIISISVFLFVIITTAAIITSYRSNIVQKELASQLWRVRWDEIGAPIKPISESCKNASVVTLKENKSSASNQSINKRSQTFVSKFSPTFTMRSQTRKRNLLTLEDLNTSAEVKSSNASIQNDKSWNGLTATAMFKSKLIILKPIYRTKIELTRKVLIELKHVSKLTIHGSTQLRVCLKMRDITHEHLTRFEGACVEWPHICILTEYCGKGSLKDILLNEEIRMDWMFRVSLMNDLVKGMSFLQCSSIQYHGNLKSTNCVVDSRFVLKITDYGLHSLRNACSTDKASSQCSSMLWTAPEKLRNSTDTPINMQKVDVYSLGIILHEICVRKGPFYTNDEVEPKEIIARVRKGYLPCFRPSLQMNESNEDVSNLMQKCWHEEPSERPDFFQIKKTVEKINKENSGNLVENLLQRMEQYAINLEGLVAERTSAYLEEKEKADELLYQMLPVPVVNRLKRGDSVPAEAFESVTICFTDIVGFTSLSAASSPMQIVDLLNDLYTCFDGIIENYDVYKVETIGDAYMLVSGLPVRNGIRHACEIARTSLQLLKAVQNFRIRHRPEDQLNLRLGIHSGPCCAGVVGLKMPRYCLFGDTVNTASRMESNGLPLSIHVSEPAKHLLEKFQSFKLELRGQVSMKGKGSLTTYWLLEETENLDDKMLRGAAC